MRRIITVILNIQLLFWIFSCQIEDEIKSVQESLFELVKPTDTGIDFQNALDPNIDFNILEYINYYNGGGIAAADFNNDGLTDLYFTGNQVSSELYLNKGNFKFENVTKKAGVKTSNWAAGVEAVDINNDGLLDLYIINSGYKDPIRRRNQLFINKGIGADGIPIFKDEAQKFGLADTSYSTQGVFFDYDKDGDLDLYLLNHDRNKKNPNFVRSKIIDGSSPGTDKLYKNEHGKFIDVSGSAGITIEGYGLGIAVADINQDNWPDIYIGNDFMFDDLLYINNRDGTFTEAIHDYIQHTSRFSMGCDIADFNNDAFPDIFSLDMMPTHNLRQKLMNSAINNDAYNYALTLGYLPQYQRNVLQLNNGPDFEGQFSFSEIGQLAGISKTDWSWSPIFADFDNDGWKDLFITNGIPLDITNNDFVLYRSNLIQRYSDRKKLMTDLLAKMEKLPDVKLSNFMFRNNGELPNGQPNLSFSNVAPVWGLNKKGLSNGAVYVDLDNDGDLDLVTNNLNSFASVYKNNCQRITENNFLRIKLNGEYPVGAKITIICNEKKQFIEHYPYSGLQSSQEPIVHFGLGKDRIVDTLTIIWPDDKMQQLVQINANQIITLDHKNATDEKRIYEREKISPIPLLINITESSGINYSHIENLFDDFNYEPLVPHKFSRNGPYLAIGDVDNNGLEDFWIGGSAKNPGNMFLQQSGGGFINRKMPDPGYEDMGGVFFDANGDNYLDLYVVSGGNEYNPNTATYQDRLYINDGKGNFTIDVNALPNEVSSGSCVLAKDFDKDGDLDLFVGGRVVPGRYPIPPRSFILQNDGNGNFHDVTQFLCPGLVHIGLVTTALWSDFDNDGWADLIVTGEWMPITIFKNDHGKLKRMQNHVSLDNFPGWWFSIAEGDFDKDGDADYIVGNLGLNNKYNVSEKTPLTVYAKDFDLSGSIEVILSFYLKGKEFPVANRDEIALELPSIKRKFDTYTKFAEAEFNQLFSKEQLKGALVLKASKFASVYLENMGNGQFAFHDLPIEAQFSTIQSILVKDFDEDGNLDALIAGNFYSPDYMTGRYDASIGLLLKGNGKGGFAPVSAQKSGISIKGDTRAMEFININKKSCILVAINSGKLQVYQLMSNGIPFTSN